MTQFIRAQSKVFHNSAIMDQLNSWKTKKKDQNTKLFSLTDFQDDDRILF